MYCTNCGKEIDGNSKFCQHCGKAIASAESNSSIDTTIANNPTTEISTSKSKNKKWIFAVCGVIAVVLIAIFAFGGNNSLVKDVEKILEDDLGSSVTITHLYYNEEKQACLVEFKTSYSTEVAAVYLDSGKALYDSDFDYYTNKMNTATTSSERGKWASKVLEYSDLAGWKFTVATSSTEELLEYGWKKIK